MLRRIGCWALVLVMLAGFPALAEDGAGCWTTREDEYYHLDPNCGGVDETRYPLSVEAALAFDKLPCPDCAAPDGAGIGTVEAAERGGTWILRVPVAAMGELNLERPAGDGAPDPLAALYASTVTDAPGLMLAVPAGGLTMNLRVVDGDCYVVSRPGAPYSAENPVRWRVESLSLGFFGDNGPKLSAVSGEQSSAPVLSGEGYAQVFDARFDAGDLTVYRALGANIAVVHWAADAAGEAALIRVRDMADIPVMGYVAGENWTYCCVLTDAELGALVAGAQIELSKAELPEAGETAQAPAVPDLSGDELEGEAPREGEAAFDAPDLPEGWSNTVFD